MTKPTQIFTFTALFLTNFLLFSAVASPLVTDSASPLRLVPFREQQVQNFAEQGKNTSFGLILAHFGKIEEKYTINVSSKNKWKVSFPPQITFLPWQRKIFQIQIQVPQDVKIDSEETITVSAQGQTNREAVESQILSIHISKSLPRDTDQDGASDEMEMMYGTDPFLPDSDRDALFDGIELLGISSESEKESGIPILALEHSDITYLDTDGDFLPDRYEKKYQIDPKKADTDGDSLPDGEEAFVIRETDIPADKDGNNIFDALEAFVVPKKEILRKVPKGEQASAIIASETDTSSRIKIKDPFQKIIESKSASTIFGVSGVLFLLAIIIVVAHLKKNKDEEGNPEN